MTLPRHIARMFGMLEMDVMKIANSAPFRYKVFTIPKRNSDKKRTIAQPSVEVKLIQRAIVKRILTDLPIHECATAYKKGSGIKANALRHVGNRYLIKTDFTDFFPSIKPNDLKQHLVKHHKNSYDEDDFEFLEKILFWKNKKSGEMELCIGAPSSPFISNTIMFDFDDMVYEELRKLKVNYSRYADDVTLSASDSSQILAAKEVLVGAVKSVVYPKVCFNNDKTVYASKKNGRRITGVVINNNEHLSVGRERKRLIRSMIHHYKCGKLSKDDVLKLHGLLLFCHDIEPDFIDRMREKYSNDTINRIFKLN